MDRSHLTDEDIARLVQGGDIDAFGVLVDRYEQKLSRYGKRFLSQHDDIEDIVQDVFFSAFRNLQSFDASLRFSPWIYRIAHNAYVNALRKDEHYVRSIDFDTLISYVAYEDPVESERDQKDMRSMIENGLTKIPPKYREVLTLHYFDEHAYKDIADILQVPVGTVSIRMKRAKAALKTAIEHDI